jgi:hypothetical protein
MLDMSAAATQPRVLHLSTVTGGALRDRDGQRIGRVDDLIVRLGGAGYPPITGFLVTVAGRNAYLPAERASDLEIGSVTLTEPKLDLRTFARRPEEVLLKHDILDHQLINVDGARLVRANEVELARVEGWWRVVGVDTGARGGFRRLLPRPLGRRIGLGDFLDWACVEPFAGDVAAVRLRILHPRLGKLHPAQIADLVEAASHREGEEIIRAVGQDDRELEAEVFEELDERHQKEFIAERSDEEVADVVARMAPDDAADLVAELDDDRRAAVLALLPAAKQRKVRSLLGYDPAEAGGLMSTDFISVYRQATVGEVLERISRSSLPGEQLATVYVMDAKHRFLGGLSLARLIGEEPTSAISHLTLVAIPHLIPEANFEEVARLMADYNLIAAPVLDGEERMIGIVTVDDVLEVMLPKGWRRRFGLLGDE